ncbi:LysR family transcriptional regulator [Streptomyces sp. NPDC002536]
MFHWSGHGGRVAVDPACFTLASGGRRIGCHSTGARSSGISGPTSSLETHHLHALHALLKERSATRAARRLGRTQPTLSSALARLRRHLGGELLTRVGNHYELNTFAEQLLPRVNAAVAAFTRAFGADPEFLGRKVDYYRTVDGVMLPHGYIGLPRSFDPCRDRWVCVIDAANSRGGDRLTMDHLRELPWATTFQEPLDRSPAWRQMELLGVRPRVTATADSFLTMTFLIRRTDGIALMQEQLARPLGCALGVRVMDCPFDVVPLVEGFWWHPVHDADPGHAWLRDALSRASADYITMVKVLQQLVRNVGGTVA